MLLNRPKMMVAVAKGEDLFAAFPACLEDARTRALLLHIGVAL